MYGKKRYRPIQKPLDQAPPPSDPTFVCSKCQRIKLQTTGYTDISLTPQIQPTKNYRICTECSLLLQAWVNI